MPFTRSLPSQIVHALAQHGCKDTIATVKGDDVFKITLYGSVSTAELNKPFARLAQGEDALETMAEDHRANAHRAIAQLGGTIQRTRDFVRPGDPYTAYRITLTVKFPKDKFTGNGQRHDVAIAMRPHLQELKAERGFSSISVTPYMRFLTVRATWPTELTVRSSELLATIRDMAQALGLPNGEVDGINMGRDGAEIDILYDKAIDKNGKSRK